ncbi:hypothetical protein BKA62DRAFT_204376 [Auriculariales sp. MPI-PUGE-AT-0066]|nr:hypothetical protein BKA62DRAFT_204376 [Auriculariales sp. MPI-PUGE-AT-0066]
MVVPGTYHGVLLYRAHIGLSSISLVARCSWVTSSAISIGFVTLNFPIPQSFLLAHRYQARPPCRLSRSGYRLRRFISFLYRTEVSSSNPSGPQGPPISDKAPRPEHDAGPNIAAIIGPIVAIILLIAGGILLWLLRRRRHGHTHACTLSRDVAPPKCAVSAPGERLVLVRRDAGRVLWARQELRQGIWHDQRVCGREEISCQAHNHAGSAHDTLPDARRAHELSRHTPLCRRRMSPASARFRKPTPPRPHLLSTLIEFYQNLFLPSSPFDFFVAYYIIYHYSVALPIARDFATSEESSAFIDIHAVLDDRNGH